MPVQQGRRCNPMSFSSLLERWVLGCLLGMGRQSLVSIGNWRFCIKCSFHLWLDPLLVLGEWHDNKGTQKSFLSSFENQQCMPGIRLSWFVHDFPRKAFGRRFDAPKLFGTLWSTHPCDHSRVGATTWWMLHDQRFCSLSHYYGMRGIGLHVWMLLAGDSVLASLALHLATLLSIRITSSSSLIEHDNKQQQKQPTTRNRLPSQSF